MLRISTILPCIRINSHVLTIRRTGALCAGNMATDGQFVFEDGLQLMSGTNGFTSWLSLPHFLYASTTIQRRFTMTPSESLHLPFVSAVTTDDLLLFVSSYSASVFWLKGHRLRMPLHINVGLWDDL